uniref:CRM domain-containing protein n=1 Tax=Oryza meridionalis TaxID=40149 RepID=A0A0E0DFL9_9ORYZ
MGRAAHVKARERETPCEAATAVQAAPTPRLRRTCSAVHAGLSGTACLRPPHHPRGGRPVGRLAPSAARLLRLSLRRAGGVGHGQPGALAPEDGEGVAADVPAALSLPRYTSHKVFHRDVGFFSGWQSYNLQIYCCIHTSRPVNSQNHTIAEPQQKQEDVTLVDESGRPKAKRKKLKGRRAVTRFLKSLRWKKKREFQRMTAEEKILYKLKLARNKEERLVAALKKIEPDDPSEPTHDPEVLTPEEHFYFLKMGQKSKNYVPVGRRGIYRGVILNMHLHWKKHQTLQVIVKTFTPDEVKEIASELARLSGGIVLDIQEGNTIIMYRGKNYAQPPPEIMSPKVTLPRKKALDKSKYRERLRALRRYIPRLEQELVDLHAQMKLARYYKGQNAVEDITCISDSVNSTSAKEYSSWSVRKRSVSDLLSESIEGSGRLEDENYEVSADSASESITYSESEDLSDIFETDSEEEQVQESKEQPLYLDKLDKFPSENNDNEPDDFEEHLRKIASLSDRTDSSAKELKVSELDEIDKIFLRASSLLKKR